jgi:hypothetical protein
VGIHQLFHLVLLAISAQLTVRLLTTDSLLLASVAFMVFQSCDMNAGKTVREQGELSFVISSFKNGIVVGNKYIKYNTIKNMRQVGMINGKFPCMRPIDFFEQQLDQGQFGFKEGVKETKWSLQNSQIDPTKINGLTYPFIKIYFAELSSRCRVVIESNKDDDCSPAELDRHAMESILHMHNFCFGYYNSNIIKIRSEKECDKVLLAALFVSYFGPLGNMDYVAAHRAFASKQTAQLAADNWNIYSKRVAK